MTITHLSHFGLETIGQTEDNIILEGTLGACKRMASAHGLEVTGTEGATIGCDGMNAIVNTATTVRYLLTRGMIQKTRDGWCLVMPMDVWMND